MVMAGDLMLIGNIFPLLILFILTFLEIGVAVIQAYIFTLLVCMYLKDVFVGH
jgi:F0F1-type ATP synthase membrane subunit a